MHYSPWVPALCALARRVVDPTPPVLTPCQYPSYYKVCPGLGTHTTSISLRVEILPASCLGLWDPNVSPANNAWVRGVRYLNAIKHDHLVVLHDRSNSPPYRFLHHGFHDVDV